jgi:GntR family transcriptional regulator, transcriptional repressor for pyruvate dehydrogenase complex
MASAPIALPPKPSFPEVWGLIADYAASLNLASGEPLPAVRELAERIGAKPSVVRDALLQAQAKGAVRIVPRVGAFLSATPAEARRLVCDEPRTDGPAWSAACSTAWLGEQHNPLHILDARRLIEVEMIGRSAELRRLEDLLPARKSLEAMLNLPADAPRLAYIELDYQFHSELARPAGNAVLSALQRKFQEIASQQFADLPANLEQRSISDRYHAAIYAAVADGDAPRARREMHEHLSVTYDYLMSTLPYPPANPPAAATA